MTTRYGWDTVSTIDPDTTNSTNQNNELVESLVGYPRPGETVPTAQSMIQVQVIAPATLPEGYEFDASFGSINGPQLIKVKVPPGGIEKGQSFLVNVTPDRILGSSAVTNVASYSNATTNNTSGAGGGSLSIPVGHWRDGICDCFHYGICHAHCCASYWCTLLALGQVITRLKLTWRGTVATNPSQTSAAFSIVFIITVIHFVAIVVLYITVLSLDPNDYSKPEPPGGWKILSTFELLVIQVYQLLKWSYFIIIVVLTYQIRTVVRAKYAIPGEPVADGILSLVLPCFVVGQMLRHTTDYDTYPANLCTSTGLSSNVPSIV